MENQMALLDLVTSLYVIIISSKRGKKDLNFHGFYVFFRFPLH